jgi:hypothetical protein
MHRDVWIIVVIVYQFEFNIIIINLFNISDHLGYWRFWTTTAHAQALRKKLPCHPEMKMQAVDFLQITAFRTQTPDIFVLHEEEDIFTLSFDVQRDGIREHCFNCLGAGGETSTSRIII